MLRKSGKVKVARADAKCLISKTKIYHVLTEDIYRRKHNSSLVMQMEYLTIPEFPVFRGEKAIKALNGFVNELEERRCEQLTVEQTTTLINIAKALLSSVQA